MANPKLAPGQLEEERIKRRAGSHRTDGKRVRREDDPLRGLGKMLKPKFVEWCKKRGMPMPSEFRQNMNEAAYKRAARFLDLNE